MVVLPRLLVVPALALALAGLLQTRAATPAPTPEQVEFFEKKVRPVLVAHCYKCHSAEAKKVRGKLRLDSRGALIKGGESGTSLVPGKPEASRLIEAVRYANPDMQMPPRGKLSDAAIADLTAWVRMGAPWPAEKAAGKTAHKEEKFDLDARKAAHWSWKPVKASPPPAVKDAAWAANPIDRFILAGLEEKGLKPAAAADRRTLIRRLTFDLTGLPPTPEEVDAFVRDGSADATERVVDRLLASPRFGERWARHWLDLVRYAETRGHEFDYTIPGAYHYRDAVIRAFNADLPYDRFVVEHVAGDLLSDPRIHPELGSNESLLATAFWFLGEEIHSPVDIRADQADRFDNRIDVMSKAFLGLTVACARCHDHKFDPIPTKDYYALYGFLSSSSYRLARFESREHNRRIGEELAALREKHLPAVRRTLAGLLRPGVESTGDYLAAAREVLREPRTAAGGPREADLVFEDFESGTYDRWEVSGTAFGKTPHTLATTAPYQGKINAAGKYFVNSHNVRGGGRTAEGDAHTGRMRSRAFTVTHDAITMLVGGGAHEGKTCVNLLVGGKVVLSATGRNDNQMFPVRWDVRPWKGQPARIEIVDDHKAGWGNVGVDQIVFTNRPASEARRGAADFPRLDRTRTEAVARARKLDPARLHRWLTVLSESARDPDDPLHPFALLLAAPEGRAGEVLQPVLAAWRQKAVQAEVDGKVVIDYRRPLKTGWLPDDVTFGGGPALAGQLRVEGTAGRPAVRFVTGGGAALDPFWREQKLSIEGENDPGSLGQLVRAGRTLRTPTFTLNPGRVHYLVRGVGLVYASVGSHVMLAGPLHGRLLQKVATGSNWRWVTHDLTPYKGQQAHLEFTPQPGFDLAIGCVVQGERPPAAVSPAADSLARVLQGADSFEKLVAGYQRLLGDVVSRLSGDGLTTSADAPCYARLADWMTEHGGLFGLDGEPAVQALSEVAGAFLKGRAGLASRVRRSSHLAPAMQDGSPVDEPVFIRGSPKAPGQIVPRHFLTALGGEENPAPANGSGRLELARQITDPQRNPFVTRVMVNRIWHHLLGRGIVASVDDFGVMGQPPTHPELLDWLADRFVRDGWSVKKTVRRIVLSRTYQQASTGDPEAEKLDPENRLRHRAGLRRLQAEAIRDSLLALSGQLDPAMYGRSVPVHLTEFQQGRGRPASGPLDGAGRRSIYLAVRRNFLSPFLLAFDAPQPFSAVGKRTVSNVPAQSLILMNDPFVHQQARLWAKRTLAGEGTARERVERMYAAAFGRPPAAEELAACLEFVGTSRDENAWADLAHGLINVKEFIFLR